MSTNRKSMLLTGASVLALGLSLATVAKAQTSAFGTTPNVFSAVTGFGAVLNGTAAQVNNATVAALTGTQAGSSAATVSVVTTNPFPGPPARTILITTLPTVTLANGAVRILNVLGATSGSTATIATNQIFANATGNEAARTLNLSLVDSNAPTALLGLRQVNSNATATAQVGVNATLGPVGSPVFSPDQATYLALTDPFGTAVGSATQTVTSITDVTSTGLLITGSTADGATATVGGSTAAGANSVQARVVFNNATQTAQGSASSGLTGAPATASVNLLTGSPAGNSVTITAPVIVASDQLNSNINTALTAPTPAPTLGVTPTAFVVNTDIGVRLSGSATNTTTLVGQNAVDATVVGNMTNNFAILEAASSAAFANGVAVVSTQANDSATTLAAIVQGTDIGTRIGALGGTSPAFTAPGAYSGTATVANNAVTTVAVGNSATASLGNTIGTALTGNFALSANNIDLDNSTSVATADMLVMTAQDNNALRLLAGTSGTRMDILADLTGTARLEQNRVAATSVLNEATGSVTALRGTSVTAAGGLVQLTNNAIAQSVVTGTDLGITGITVDNAGTTAVLGANSIAATTIFNTGSQRLSADSTFSGATQGTASLVLETDDQLVARGQLSLTSFQEIEGSALRPLANRALSEVATTNLGIGLFPGATLSATAPMTLDLSGNSVAAAFSGNVMANVISLETGAQTRVSGLVAGISQEIDTIAAGAVFDARTTATTITINPFTSLATVPVGGVNLEGTALLGANSVTSSVRGNVAANSVGNTLNTALGGAFLVSGTLPLGTLDLTSSNDAGSTLLGDVVLGIAQAVDEDMTFAARTDATTLQIQANVIGTVRLEGNRVAATTSVNIAEQGFAAVRGSALTLAAGVNQQIEDDGARVFARSVVDATTIRALGTSTLSGSTVLVNGNTVAAATNLNIVAQSGTFASTVAGGTSNGGSLVTGSLGALGQVAMGTNQGLRDVTATSAVGSVPVPSSQTLIHAELLGTTGTLPSTTAQVSGNAVTATTRGNLAASELSLSGAADIGLRGAVVGTSQTNQRGVLGASVYDVFVHLSALDSSLSQAPMRGTAIMSDNTVAAASLGNEASTTVGNSLATQLTGLFSRTGNNLALANTGAVTTAQADIVLGTSQVNDDVQAGRGIAVFPGFSPNIGTAYLIVQGVVNGSVELANNRVTSTTTLNNASHDFRALRGSGLTVVSAINQANTGVRAGGAPDVGDAYIIAVGMRVDSGSTIRVVDNTIAAATTLSTAAQVGTLATTLGAGGAAGGSITTGSLLAAGQAVMGTNQTATSSQASATVFDASAGITMGAFGVPTAATTALVTGNTISAAAAGQVAGSALALEGAAAIALRGGVVATSQTSTSTAIAGSVEFARFSVAGSTDGFRGTAAVDGNRVLASSVTNEAASALSTGVGTVLSGTFLRNTGAGADNVSVAVATTPGAPGVTAAADLLVVTDQRSYGGLAPGGAAGGGTSRVLDTQFGFFGNFAGIVGTATVDDNVMAATTSGNVASQVIGASNGSGLTTAGVVNQANIGDATAELSFFSAVTNQFFSDLVVQSAAGRAATLSVSDNLLSARTTLNRSAQVATASLTAGAGTADSASVAMILTGPLLVGAQLSLTTQQANVGVNTALGSDPASLVSGASLEVNIAAPFPAGAASQTVTLSGNQALATTVGNVASSGLTLDGAANNSADGIAVATRQINERMGSLGAQVGDVRVAVTTYGLSGPPAPIPPPFSGTITIAGNQIGSTSVANSSVNTLSNAMGTVSGGFVPTTTTTANFGFDESSTTVSAQGDLLVVNAQRNSGVTAAAATINSTLTANLAGTPASFGGASTVSVNGNRVTAVSALNETSNALSVSNGDGVVAGVGSFQVNAYTTPATGPNAATALVRDTNISIVTAAGSSGSTLNLNQNLVGAQASGNVATNVLSNGGNSSGGLYPTAGVTLGATTAPTTSSYADFSVANRQQNIGTGTSPFVVNAQVLNAGLNIQSTLSAGTASMSGNVVMASAAGNSAFNRLDVSGQPTFSAASMSFQENRFASISASVQGATMRIQPSSGGSMTGSTMAITGNQIGAMATGNSLTAVIGR